MVTGIPGLKGLPCMPNPGSKEIVAFVPNGTFLTFVQPMFLGDDCTLWLMSYSDRNEVQVLITPDALTNGWLWRAKRVGQRPLRRY